MCIRDRFRLHRGPGAIRDHGLAGLIFRRRLFFRIFTQPQQGAQSGRDLAALMLPGFLGHDSLLFALPGRLQVVDGRTHLGKTVRADGHTGQLQEAPLRGHTQRTFVGDPFDDGHLARPDALIRDQDVYKRQESYRSFFLSIVDVEKVTQNVVSPGLMGQTFGEIFVHLNPQGLRDIGEIEKTHKVRSIEHFRVFLPRDTRPYLPL